MRKASPSANLTQKITHTLGAKIVTGVYSETNQLPVEAELCKQLGASRSILREAVKMLTAKGLIMARPRLGTQVRPEYQWNMLDPDVLGWMSDREYSKDLLVEFIDTRLSIEPHAAALAASNGTPNGKASLRNAYDQMAKSHNDEEEYLESDMSFHRALLETSGNRFFLHLAPMCETAICMSARVINHRNSDVLSDHLRIVEAVEAGESRVAHDKTEEMLNNLRDIILAA